MMYGPEACYGRELVSSGKRRVTSPKLVFPMLPGFGAELQGF